MTSEVEPTWPAERFLVCHTFWKYGIDPRTIIEDSLSTKGYETFSYNAAGGRVLNGEDWERTFVPWENEIVAGEVLKAVQQQFAKRFFKE